MTERLAALMREETESLPVPPPATADILAAGRRMRRTRRLAAGVVVGLAAASVLAATLGASALLADDGPTSQLPAASAAQLAGWAVASGSSVQLGNGRTVEVDGTVKSLYYTSVGVLVRSGDDARTDSADSSYSLIDEFGDVTDFTLELGDRVPGTDPAQPFLVYAEPTGDPRSWDVVVRDVRTGEVVQTVPVRGAFTWGGWVAPPVSLSGSHAYVGLDRATLDIDLETSTVTESEALPASTMPTVQNGREVVEERAGTASVVDAQTGELLFEHRQGDRLLSLSPDGRFAVAYPWRTCEDDGRCTWDLPTVVVHDLATGTQQEFDVTGTSFGWTPDGDLLLVDDATVEVCDAASGACRSTPVDVDGQNLRLGGTGYEI